VQKGRGPFVETSDDGWTRQEAGENHFQHLAGLVLSSKKGRDSEAKSE